MNPLIFAPLFLLALALLAVFSVRRNKALLASIAETGGLSFEWHGWNAPWTMERELDRGTLRVEMTQRPSAGVGRKPFTTVSFTLTPRVALPEGVGMLQSSRLLTMMRELVDPTVLDLPMDYEAVAGASIGLEAESLEVADPGALKAWLDAREGRRDAMNQVVVAGSHGAALYSLVTPTEIRHEIRDNSPRAMVYLTLISSLEDLAATLD